MRLFQQKVGEWIVSVGEKISGKQREDVDLQSIENLLLHDKYKKHFEATSLKEKKSEWILTATERKDLIPKELEGKSVVLNGYKEKVEVVDFPLKGKLVYLRFIRRRWREKDGTKSYFNSYKLHPKGMKATVEFGSFLKELSRQEYSDFCSSLKSTRLIEKEDLGMV